MQNLKAEAEVQHVLQHDVQKCQACGRQQIYSSHPVHKQATACEEFGTEGSRGRVQTLYL